MFGFQEHVELRQKGTGTDLLELVREFFLELRCFADGAFDSLFHACEYVGLWGAGVVAQQRFLEKK